MRYETAFPYVDRKNAATLEIMRAGTSPRACDALPLGPIRLGPIPFEGEYEVWLPEERVVEGRVVAESGEPVGNERLWAWNPAWTPDGPPARGATLTQYGSTTTASDGSFRIGRLGSDPVDLVVEQPEGYLPTGPVPARAETRARIVLRRGARAVVRVHDAFGDPVEGAIVLVSRLHNAKRQRGSWPFRDWFGTTNASGTARISGLESAEKYRLRVWERRWYWGGRAAVTIDSWRPAGTVVRVGPAHGVVGKVVDSRGEPRPDANVYAKFEDGTEEPVGVDRAGRFLLYRDVAGLVEFTAAIDVAIRGVRGVAAPVVARTGDRAVRLVIDRPPTIELRLRGWPLGEYFAGATLSSDDDPSLSLKRTIDIYGYLTIEGLPKGQTWSMYIGPLKDGRFALLRGIATKPTVQEFKVQLGGEIRGVVVVPPRYARAQVSVHDRVVKIATVATRRGRFVLRGVPPGRWTITASASNGDHTARATTSAQAGDSIRIELR